MNLSRMMYDILWDVRVKAKHVEKMDVVVNTVCLQSSLKAHTPHLAKRKTESSIAERLLKW